MDSFSWEYLDSRNDGKPMLPPVTVDYLSELVHQFRKDNMGEYPHYISLSIEDAHRLEAEMYSIGAYHVVADKAYGRRLRFQGAEIIRSSDIAKGEVILSRRNWR